MGGEFCTFPCPLCMRDIDDSRNRETHGFGICAALCPRCSGNAVEGSDICTLCKGRGVLLLEGAVQ